MPVRMSNTSPRPDPDGATSSSAGGNNDVGSVFREENNKKHVFNLQQQPESVCVCVCVLLQIKLTDINYWAH